MNAEKMKALGVSEEIAAKLAAEMANEAADAAKTEAQKDRTISEYRAQIEGLKRFEGDAAALKKHAEELEAENKKKADAFASEMTEYKRKSASRLAIASHEYKPQDAELVMSLIDLSKVDIDEAGNIKTGLKEQLENLQKERPYLFKSEEKKPEGVKGFEPMAPNQKDAPAETKSIGEQLAQKVIEQRKRAASLK